MKTVSLKMRSTTPDGRNPFDLVISGTGNGRGRIATDGTPATALALALGSDRLARTDDALPNVVAHLPAQNGVLNNRKGWWGDGVLPQGQRIGSRLWLLARGKASETDRVRAQSFAQEAVNPVAGWFGQNAAVQAVWVGKGFLQIRVTVGSTTLGSVLGGGHGS